MGRYKFALAHLLVSLTVASIVAGIVFLAWFPAPYDRLAGGRELFSILISVDVIIGPILTCIVFSPLKSKKTLIVDVFVIAGLQVGALAYGVFSVTMARPVILAAENKMFRVVSANGVKIDELAQAPTEYRQLSWTGPRLVGVRRSGTPQELLQAIDLAKQGYDTGTRPSYWVPYSDIQRRVLEQAVPLTNLQERSLGHNQAITAAAFSVQKKMDDLSALPLMARQNGWYVLLDRKTAEVLGFARLEPLKE